MKTILKLTGGILIVLIVTIAAVFITGHGQQFATRIMLMTGGPDGNFNAADTVAAPDYDDPRYWAALPERDDPADLIPAGIDASDIQGSAPVDVFFIHPTGYLSGASWNSPMNETSATEENTQWMMANQASAYNGCCNVYAPRYREATIYSYFIPADERDRVHDLAYQDVAHAFDYFIRHYNEGRPFIIASHSQGTHHAKRLLKEKIDNSPLFDRMVAAYVIGSVMIEYSPAWLAGLTHIKPCTSATETGCIIHWDTFKDKTGGYEREEGQLCTNPLTWEVNENFADASLNVGAVPILIPYNLTLDRANPPAGVHFTELAAPIPRHTWAQCRGGTLFVAAQDREPILGRSPDGNYHGLDYALFYMDIRDNAILRANTYLAKHQE